MIIFNLLRGQVSHHLLKETLRIIGLFARPRVHRGHFYLPIFINKNIIRPYIPTLHSLLMINLRCRQYGKYQVPQLTFLKQLKIHRFSILNLITQQVRVVAICDVRDTTVTA